MAKSFTEREKENIKRNLQEVCKKSWTQYGCKKTSVDDLCKQAGISKGAFYLFFESKEA
ncbi:MAG: TetR/AcrR family transcriptional regulator, partial [Lachnospiraceae bacterium]|nr:TetR/AcrR family transcriptional regulator [Lachnospiraceae bacterium]